MEEKNEYIPIEPSNLNTFGTPLGWQCPVCGRVYSPAIIMCFSCGNESNVITSTGTDTEPIRKMMIEGIPFEDLGFSKTV